MGFWSVIGRVVQGKPGFEAPPPDDSWDDDEPTADFADERQAKRAEVVSTSLVDERGYKQIPVASVTKVQSKLSGNRIELWATIRNQSSRDIFLDKITLLGARTELDYPLSPSAQREFKIYSGTQLTHDNYKTAELYYKDVPSGDYFRADHMLEYTYESDSTYEVVEFKLIMPIRDV